MGTSAIEVTGLALVGAPLLLRVVPPATIVDWEIVRLATSTDVPVEELGTAGGVRPTAAGVHECRATVTRPDSTVEHLTAIIDVHRPALVVKHPPAAVAWQRMQITAGDPDHADLGLRWQLSQPDNASALVDLDDKPADIRVMATRPDGIDLQHEPGKPGRSTLVVDVVATVRSPISGELVDVGPHASHTIEILPPENTRSVPRAELDERVADLATLKSLGEKWSAALTAILGVYALTTIITAPTTIDKVAGVPLVVALAATTLTFILALLATYHFGEVARGIPRLRTAQSDLTRFNRTDAAVRSATGNLRVGRRETFMAAAVLAAGSMFTVIAATTPVATNATSQSLVVAGTDTVTCVNLTVDTATVELPFQPAHPPVPVDTCPRDGTTQRWSFAASATLGLAATLATMVVAAWVAWRPTPTRTWRKSRVRYWLGAIAVITSVGVLLGLPSGFAAMGWAGLVGWVTVSLGESPNDNQPA